MIKYIENFRINYKTELCKNYMKTGCCEFHGECAYAHGYVELAPKPSHLHKNYKTKMCKKWHIDTPGNCTYGDKCQFVHEEYCMESLTKKAVTGGSPSLNIPQKDSPK
jgi:hypothetical protein|tara:strand:- start:1018 stop:1341 length:324 start_codon:yes stop_codon:yes gene_type:complete